MANANKKDMSRQEKLYPMLPKEEIKEKKRKNEDEFENIKIKKLNTTETTNS